MRVSYVSWVNNDAQYQGLLDSIPNAFETIKIGQEFKSMASAYNEGMRRAKGDAFVFVHQDVRIWDPNFELTLSEALKEPWVGLVGVIGSKGIGSPSWWDTDFKNLRGMVVQGPAQQYGHIYKLDSFGMANCSVRQIDGLLMATAQKDFVWPEEFPGIHFVDLAACRMMEEKGFVNWVIPTVVQHLSQGEISSQAFSDNRKIYESKWS